MKNKETKQILQEMQEHFMLEINEIMNTLTVKNLSILKACAEGLKENGYNKTA